VTTRREFLTQAVAASVATSCVGAGRAHQPSTGVVQTVLGPLDASKLGFTLTHEHVCLNPQERFGGRGRSVAKAVDTLKEARDARVNTIVDVTAFDVGRDIRFGQEISRKSGMQIVACTGQHLFAPESANARAVQQITELFIREIEQGIEDTDIRAGVIKVAARSAAMTPAEAKVFRAAARASKATGVPVQTHTNSRERGGEKQAGFVNQVFLSNDWQFGDIERDTINPDGLLYTTRKTIPYLRQIGVTDQEIWSITVENPRRFFGGT